MTKEQTIDKNEIYFVKFCAAMAAQITLEQLNAVSKKGRIPIARFLVMNHFYKKNRFALETIGRQTFNKDHSTVFYAIKRLKGFEDVKDSIYLPIKKEFDSLIKFENMKQLIEEADRRQKIRNANDKEAKEKLKHLQNYVRKYHKVCAKLIRTEEKPPT